MSTPQISTEPQPQARIRFADDTILPNSSSSSNQRQVLVLGPSSGDRQSTPSMQTASLDFSMIATPGRGLDNQHEYETTPSEATGASTSVVSSGIWPSGTPFSSILRGVVSSTPGMKPRQLLGSTPYTAARESISDREQAMGDADTTNDECTALAFARSAPLSGYLRKLGKNIPTFKRRFFVLKPSTHLYYFMSPTDVEPRGCIDLDLVHDHGEGGGCEVREIGVLPDGTFRFELLFDEEADDDDTKSYNDEASETGSRASQGSKKKAFQKQSIVLEARTEEIGREWMAKLQTERLSAARDEVDFIKTNLAETRALCSKWEQSAHNEGARADNAEKQRDLAFSEVKLWEGKLNELNEAVGLLAKHAAQTSDFNPDSLTEALEGLDVNGTNFGEAFDALKKIHIDYNLALKRVEKAETRATEFEQRTNDAGERLAKAEAQLGEVWEDNCSIQKELKKARREKKILVKEVRALHANAAETQKNQIQSTQACSRASSRQQVYPSDSQTNSVGDASGTAFYPSQKRALMEDERRLVIELEEHVMSGLRLSEQFLTLNGIEPSLVGDGMDDSCMQPSHSSQERQSDNLSPVRHDAVEHNQLCSLLDDDDDVDDDSTDADVNQTVQESETTTSLGLGSKGGDDAQTNHHNIIDDGSIHDADFRVAAESVQEPSRQKDDPYLYYKKQLDENRVSQNLYSRFTQTYNEKRDTDNRDAAQQPTIQSEESSLYHAPPSVGVESSVSCSSRSLITDNGYATTKLECALRDVGETPKTHRPRSSVGDDGKVYHITFYSSKIGLQFQKVPVEKGSVGLLTDAMTADHGVSVETNQTASELRRIASISQHFQTRRQQKDQPLECLPIPPVDAVLVCGFVGFDDSTGNIRPKIGARLVAFDGIPVEVGKWTFESIRKSIQARGRPLTLSFRNDFLTPNQRAILTKAVNDVKAYAPPRSQHNSHVATKTSNKAFGTSDRPTALTSSTSSVSSSSQSHKYYSFSEAGSSISSTVVPLMSNLMKGVSTGKHRQQEDFTPDYLLRQSDSLNNMRHHQDFKSSLL